MRVSSLGGSGYLKGVFHGSGSLAPYWCFASGFVIYLAIYLFKFDVFEMDTLAIESLRSGTFITVKKLNIGYLHCSLQMHYISY